MAVAKAYESFDMSPASTNYRPPTPAALFAANQSGKVTPTQIDVLDPSGRLQQYFGTFNLLDVQAGDFSTSTFTGFKQFEAATAASKLLFEISGASLNGTAIGDAVISGSGAALPPLLFIDADSISGSDQNDLLRGFDGSDSIVAGLGDDFVGANVGNDSLNGGVGNDTLGGGKGNDLIIGGADEDLLFGGDNNDSLLGGVGNDILNGNAGDDTLKGGLGADIFALSADADVINDFSSAQGDKILVNAPVTLETIDGNVLITQAGVGTTLVLGVASLAPGDIISTV